MTNDIIMLFNAKLYYFFLDDETKIGKF